MSEAILFNNGFYMHSGGFQSAFDDNSFLRYIDATNDVWDGNNTSPGFSIDYISISGSIYEYAFAYRNIPSIINMQNVSCICTGAFYSALCRSYIQITISSDYTYVPNPFIEPYAFCECHQLQTISIGTSYIGAKAFANCYNLTYAPNLFSSCYAIEEYAFSGCVSLHEIVNTSTPIYIGGHAFENCTGLYNCILSQCYYIGKGAFSNCSNLINLVIGNTFSHSSGSAFYPYIMDYAFYGTSLSKVQITYPEVDSKISYVGNCAFANCKNLTEAVIYCYNMGEDVFSGDVLLTSINMPYLEFIPDNAFRGLQSLDLILAGSATTVGNNAFGGCTKLKSVYLYNVEQIESNSFGGCFSIEQMVMSKIQSIPQGTFPFLSYVKTLAIFDNCVSIGSGNFNSMSLWSNTIYLPKIQYIYNNCFNDCYSAQYIAITNSEPCNYIGKSCFNNCYNATGVTVFCKHIDEGCFNNCSNMTNITLVQSNDYPISLGSNCFNNCSKINNIVLQCSYIGDSVFGGAKPTNLTFSLYSETFPTDFSENGLRFDNLTDLWIYNLSYIPSSYFKNYLKIQHVGLDSIDMIYDETFMNCSNLSYIRLGHGKNDVIINLNNSDALYGCTNLSVIYVPSGLYSYYINHPIWSYYSSLFSIS